MALRSRRDNGVGLTNAAGKAERFASNGFGAAGNSSVFFVESSAAVCDAGDSCAIAGGSTVTAPPGEEKADHDKATNRLQPTTKALTDWLCRVPRMNSFDRTRSEEHTSELQSLRHLVCRLLLEKKKQKKEP